MNTLQKVQILVDYINDGWVFECKDDKTSTRVNFIITHISIDEYDERVVYIHFDEYSIFMIPSSRTMSVSIGYDDVYDDDFLDIFFGKIISKTKTIKETISF